MNARTKKDESPGVTIKKFSSRSGIVSLCTPTNDEIALTLALSHRNGRGNFLDLRDLFSYPRPLAGEGRVRVRCQASTVFKRRTRRARRLELSLSRILRVLRDLRGDQLATLSFMSLLFFASSSFAQAPFYQGKTITIIRGSAPGGVGEMRTRAVANYLKKHVPGNPTILIEFMPGAGGIKAANHLYRGARTDGLVIGSAPSGMVSSAILGESGVQYDLDKFIYLGSPNSESHYVFFTNRKLGLGSMEKLRAHSGLRIGAQTVGHPIYLTGRLFALILGLKDPKFVVGYSSPELDVAMLSGELDATPGVASSVVKQNPEFLDKGLMDFHAIVEIPRGDKHPRFAQLPELDSFVRSDKERKALALHRTFRLAGSPFVLPPGTLKDRTDILREAMRKIYTDKEFLAEYQKMTGEEASPLLPDAHEKAIRELPRDPEVVEFYKLLGGTQALPPR